jgi:hypothetical protein
MTQTYKLTYNVRDHDRSSNNFGLIIQKILKFNDFNEAVRQSRLIANTNVNLIGMPVIDLTEK